MQNQSKCIIEIINWDKYNPRKDIKNPSWFAFSNRMIEDPDIYDLSHSEFRAWVYCLSRASQKASSTAEIDYRHAERICNVKQEDFEKMYQKMEKCISVRHTYADVRQSVHDKQTNKQDKQDKQTEAAVEEFQIPIKLMQDLKILESYPEKIIYEVAKEAWVLYNASDKPDKNWTRFISHYFKNEKQKIRERILNDPDAARERLIKKYEGSEYEF